MVAGGWIDSTRRQLRTAVIGCGKIADAHFAALQSIGSEIVAAVDVEPWLAAQAAARFGAARVFTDVDELIRVARPEVAHLATPPDAHLALATKLLEGGCDVYIEKPFAMDGAETAAILTTARATRRRVCPGFDHLFEPSWLKLNELRASLGEIRHIDLVFGYPMNGISAREASADPQHWVWSLPAQLLQNVIVHPLYLMLDCLREPASIVYCVCEREPSSAQVPTRLRLGLKTPTATADLHFSTRVRPQRTIRVFGTAGEAHVDLDSQVVMFSRAPTLPGSAGRIETTLRTATQAGAAVLRGADYLATGGLRSLAGLTRLIGEFHRAVVEGTAVPISEELVVQTAAMTDDVIERYADAARSAIKTQARRYQ